MAHISVLIPQRDAGSVVAAQVPAVRRVLEQLVPDFELLVIDDDSSSQSLRPLEELLPSEQHLQVLKFSPACGLSAALTAGVSAAKGDVVVTLPAGECYGPTLIESLLDELVRVDLVVGRPRRRRFQKAMHRLVRIPRWFVLGLEVRDPECLVWAAHREAVAGLELPRGMYRYLATLVAARGYRVGEVTIPTEGRSMNLSDGMPNPCDLLAAWWFKRRWRQYERVELVDASEGTRRHHAVRILDTALVPKRSDTSAKNATQRKSA